MSGEHKHTIKIGTKIYTTSTASVPVPVPPPALVVRSLPAPATAAQFLALVADMSIDVIELSGIYTGWSATINVDRSARPLTVRPAPGAIVTFSGAGATSGLFRFGQGGVAKAITMSDFTLVAWTFKDTGLVWTGNADGITLDRITLLNCNGVLPVLGQMAWCLYISYDGGVAADNITANDWTIIGAGRTLNGAQLRGTGHANIALRRWNVAHLAYAFYDSSDTAGLTLDDWTLDDCGQVAGTPASIVFTGSTGTYRNIRATNSLPLLLAPGTGMSGGGG
jgi:hypothetical protein